jgi:hypothetical protein
MSVAVLSPASRILEATLGRLADAGIEASRDPGATFPQPLAVLVGLPTLAGWTQAGRTYTVPVYVVSSDPLNDESRIDRALALTDAVAFVLGADNYRPSAWRSSVNAQPLESFELTIIATTPEEAAP